MKVESCFKIAYIVRTHGLKGEVTLSLLPECPSLGDLEMVFLQVRNQLVPYSISSQSTKGVKAYVKFESVDSLEAAEALTGCSLYLPKDSRPDLPRGAFYGDEVIGFEVVENNLGYLGKVKEIQDFGTSRLLVVADAGKEIMIPLNGPFVKRANKSRKQITVELPEGFLEL